MNWWDDFGRHNSDLLWGFTDGLWGWSSVGKPWSNGKVNIGYDLEGRKLPTAEQRSPSGAVAWRIRCACVAPDVPDEELDPAKGLWAGPKTTWLSNQQWIRVRTPEEEDLTAGRIYTSDDDLLSGEIARRDDLTHMALGIWYQHTGPTYTATIRTAALELARGIAGASERLDQAVTRARMAGVSWTFIGTATDMSHQSAQARWSRTIPRREPGVVRTAAYEVLVTPQHAAQINEILTTWDRLQRTAPRGQAVRFLADGSGMRRRDVDKLRRVRNRLAHPADGPVSDQEFRHALRTIRELWRRLSTA